jgi:polyhydroxybutyrate depolymerase
MQKTAFIFFLISFPAFCISQQTLNKSIKVDGKTRSFIIYIPATYDPGIPAPVVFSFHGYTEDANTQLLYRNFRPVADTAGFLIVCPQGIEDDLHNTHWNVGMGHSTVDDVHFIDVLIDSLESQYNIDNTRLYSAGFSNGGFFSFKLGCELSHRMAAVASVGGTFVIPQDTLCHPQHPMPVMYIHGTTDGVIPYNGNTIYRSAASTIALWSTFNANPSHRYFSST